MKKQQKMTKHKGKKKFGRFFLLRFLICELAALGLIGWQYLYKGWEACKHDTPPYLQDIAAEGVEKALAFAEKKGRSVSDALTMRISVNGIYEKALLLYQPETGEVYTSRPFALAIVEQGGKTQYYSLYDPELLNQLQDSVNALDYYADPTVYSIYTKDDRFLPGEVYMCEDRISLLYQISWYLDIPGLETLNMPGEWADLSPENTEGWVKVCNEKKKDTLTIYPGMADSDETDDAAGTDEPKLIALMLRGSPQSELLNNCTQQITERIPYYFREMQNSWEDEIHCAETMPISNAFLREHGVKTREEYVEQVKTRIEAEKQTLPLKLCFEKGILPRTEYIYDSVADKNVSFRGKEWVLSQIAVYHPDLAFKREYLTMLPIFLLASAVAVVVIALVWAVISYLIYSRRYDIDTYRRNLTGALAHDLKTPLAVIYGNAENIRAHNHPENTDEYADFIMENVTHMDEMIAGVLGLSQLKERTRPKTRDLVDLTELLHMAFHRNEALMEQRGLTLAESGRFVVEGNADMLTQLADNLAANAVQHAAEGSRITLTAEKNRLCISNPYTGELDEKTLCEPFRRGDAARGSRSGSGLGLSIVQQIAALNKIRLRITAREGVFTAELKWNPLRRSIKTKPKRPKKKERLDLTAMLHTEFQHNAAFMEERGLTLSESGRFLVTANAAMASELAENLTAAMVRHAAEGSRFTVSGKRYVLCISVPYTGELDEKSLLESELSKAKTAAALNRIRMRVTAKDGILTAELKLNPLFEPVGKQ